MIKEFLQGFHSENSSDRLKTRKVGAYTSFFLDTLFIKLGISPGTPKDMGPPSYKRDPYHSHTSRDSVLGVVWIHMGMVWVPLIGRGSHYWGSLEFPLNDFKAKKKGYAMEAEKP